MNLVIGQPKLVKILESYTVQNMPKTMLFLGPHGCGKSWIAARFAEQLGLETVTIQDNDLTQDNGGFEKLLDYYECPIEKLYLIDLHGMNVLNQQRLLKFIEEPSQTMYIILMAESELGVLPTILNRCIKYVFEPYTIDQLKQFDWVTSLDEELVYQICKTPGQLNEFTVDNVKETVSLCNTIIDKIKFANYANTLSISTKIRCKDDENKIDFDIFFEILTYLAFKKFKETNDELSFKIYQYTVRERSKIVSVAFAKENFLLSFFDGLWRLTH